MDTTALAGPLVIGLGSIITIFIALYNFLKKETDQQRANREEIIRNQEQIRESLDLIRAEQQQIQSIQAKLDSHESRITVIECVINRKGDENNGKQ